MVTEGDMDVQGMIKDSFFLSTLVVFEKKVVTKVGEAWQGSPGVLQDDQGDVFSGRKLLCDPG